LSPSCAPCEKDRNFVAALLDAGLVDTEVIASGLSTVPDWNLSTRDRALSWLASRSIG
jgi:hypothetical protein